MRVREWYGWHFPEMGKIVTDNQQYAKVVKKMGSPPLLESVFTYTLTHNTNTQTIKPSHRDAPEGLRYRHV